MNKYKIWFFKKVPQISKPLMTLIKKVIKEAQMMWVVKEHRASGSGQEEADAILPAFPLSTTETLH